MYSQTITYTQPSYHQPSYQPRPSFGGKKMHGGKKEHGFKKAGKGLDVEAFEKMGLGAWMMLATVVLGAYHLCSDGDFSFLMTLSSMVSSFGMGMLGLQLLSTGSLEGISLKALQLHSVAFFFRFISTFFHEGYLPLDRSGDYVYRGSELLSLVAAAGCIVLAYGKLNSTYEPEKDSFGNFGSTAADRAKYGASWVAVPALVLALIFHPTLNNALWSDVAWTFALYVDVLAVAPQLWMFHKSGGKVAKCTSHYVFCLGFGRLLMLCFWTFSYQELTGFAGIFVMLSQVVGAVLMADFFYYYAKSQQSGQDLVLPSAVDMV